MSLTAATLANRHLANVLSLAVMGLGVYAASSIPVEVYPEVETQRAVVVSQWPGASAAEVESQVTDPLESRLESIARVASFESKSSAGVSQIMVQFESAGRARVESAFRDLKGAIESLPGLPEGLIGPEVRRLSLEEDAAFLRIAVFQRGARDDIALSRAARRLKSQLEELPDVAEAQLLGEGYPEIRVALDRTRLEAAGVAPDEVATAIRRANIVLPAGAVRVEAGHAALTSEGALDDPTELAGLLVRATDDGRLVRLGELGRVERHVHPTLGLTRYRAHPCIVVNVLKRPGANTLAVRGDAVAVLDAFRAALPTEMGAELAIDLTPWITQAMRVLESNLALGAALVLVVLCLFFGMRASLLAFLGIPFSALCTLVLMRQLGLTLNTASVFAMVLVSGMIVDDAIVVLDNVHLHLAAGHSLRDAIVRGVDEVAAPVCASALTTVLAFLPIGMMEGDLADLFVVIPTVVGLTLLSSLFECLVILPVHLYEFYPRGAGQARAANQDATPEEIAGAESDSPSAPLRAFEGLVTRLVRVRYLAPVALVAMLLLSLAAAGRLRTEALPSDFPMLTIEYQLHERADIHDSDQAAAELSLELERLTDEGLPLASWFSVGGMRVNPADGQVAQANAGQFWLQLRAAREGQPDPEETVRRIRAALEQARVGRLADARIEWLRVSPSGAAPGLGQPIQVRVEHDDNQVALAAATRLRGALGGISGVIDVRDTVDPGPLQLKVRAREPECALRGLSLLDVAQALFAANIGIPAGTMNDPESGRRLPVRVLLDASQRGAVATLLELPLPTPSGLVRLGDVATHHYEQDLAVRRHHNGRRSITVTAGVDAGAGVDLGVAQRRLIQEAEALRVEHPGLRVHVMGDIAQRQQGVQSLIFAGLLAAALIYVVLTATMRSYFAPLCILVTLGYGVLGVTAALVLHGFSVNVVTFVATVGLFGVVVNDAIVLVTFIGDERRRGLPRDEAIRGACRRRLRPILLTTFTTIAGLLPMAIGFGGRSTIWSPFATIFCYGLGVSTTLTLLWTPAIYAILDDVANLMRRLAPREAE